MKRIGILLYMLMVGIFLMSCSSPKEEFKSPSPTVTTKEKQIEKINVDIKGAVLNPGVYQLKQGTVSDVIQMSGGLLENADTRYLNLSKKLKDEMVVIVYTKEEIEQFEKGNELKLPIQTCVCPKVTNDGCLDKSKTITNKKEGEVKKEEGPHIISIQTASKEEFMTLPGIGDAKAQAIIQYREKNGFETIEDMKKVKGIGNSIFEKIKAYLTL